jgi:hypothetical protein
LRLSGPMRPLETIGALARFERRGPGTDAERQAARWLAGELIAQRYRVRIETFWCRPNWALAHAWHVALALAGSLLAPSHPTVGAILLALALASILMDEVAGISPGRRLTPERASQNVIATARQPSPDATAAAPPAHPTLIVTANYDAGRTALVYRDAVRRPAAALRRRAGRLALGWLAWLWIAIAWLLAIATTRATTHHASTTLGVFQLPPTIALVLGFALLLEAAAAGYGPAANDNASGVAVAIELARAIAMAPPNNLDLELVLSGAGEGGEIGLRRHLRIHNRANVIVLGIGPCGLGRLHSWVSDGRLIPLRYARPLRELADITQGVDPVRARGAAPAFPARARGMPAISVGCLDAGGLPPRSHQPSDVPEAVDEATLDRALEFVLLLASETANGTARPA